MLVNYIVCLCFLFKLLQMTNVQHLINKKWRNGSDELNVKKVMKQFYDTVNDIYLKTGGIDKFNSTIPKSFPKLLVEDWKQYFTETDKTLNRKEMKDLQEITNIKDSTDQISKEITGISILFFTIYSSADCVLFFLCMCVFLLIYYKLLFEQMTP